MTKKKAETKKQPSRRLELMPLRDITGADRNPKKHAHEDIGASIGRFGYVEPVVLDERTGRLVAGHGRVQALRVARKKGEAPPQGVEERNGEWFIPVIRGWASRSDAEAEAYLVASNHLTTKGGWDDAQLVELLQGLEKQAALDGTGFTPEDITTLLDNLNDDDIAEDSDEGVQPPPSAFQVLVKCKSEQEQADLLMRLDAEGFECRSLIS